VIVDIGPDDGCMSLEAMVAAVTDQTRAVVVVHIYGAPVDVARVRELVTGRNILVIEDLAQAVGGSDWAGRLLGTLGDYSVFSFAQDKIIEGEGGALVRHHRAPALSLDGIELPPPIAPRILGVKALSLRNLTHALADLARDQPTTPVSHAFHDLVPAYRDLYVRNGPDGDRDVIARGFAQLDATRHARYRNYARYRDGIKSAYARVVSLPASAMIWRCPVLAADREHAAALTALLRQHRVHASNHYFPLDKMLADRSQPGSLAFSSRIINLWVEPCITDIDVQRAIDLINRYGGA
jgi:dTDP-4-amino-4,6-dideoxygalactose transaminase